MSDAMPAKILVVDDDAAHRTMLNAVLSAEGYTVQEADDGDTACRAVEQTIFDLVLMDLRMKRMHGDTAQAKMRVISPGTPVVIMTAYGSVRSAVKALKSGARDYLTKPIDTDELKLLVTRILHHRRLETENQNLKQRLNMHFNFGNIIGRSPSMRKLFDMLALVAPSEATILIQGESGTGKELVANAIHHNSRRQDRPFIKVNCAALPENLLENELFGHEKGAFTGALGPQKGRFQLAHQGSLFLDEIAEMTPATQAKILRVLQEREFEPVGGNRTIRVDVRIISATNRHLEAEIAAGRFREDLYYRLNVVTVTVPPLRERTTDIPLLADYFLKQYARKNHRRLNSIQPRAMDMLLRHAWPGNVRELENIIERAVIMAREVVIRPEDFPAFLQDSNNDTPAAKPVPASGRLLKDMEKEMIMTTLEDMGGNRTKTAALLGISRRTLQLKLKDYGIN